MSIQAFTGALRAAARAGSWIAAAGFVFAVPACSQGTAAKIDSASQAAGQGPAFSLAPARPEGQFELAMRYDAGNGVAADDAWAEYWAWRAALQGHAPAREWLRKRARTEPLDAVIVFDVLTGSPRRVHRSAELWVVLAGPDPEGSPETRRKLLQQSFPVVREQALRGDAWAKYLVGVVHEFALADSGEARRWYTEAAELGNVLAQDSLGHLYEEGRGVNADSAQAARWFQAAASQGYAPAESMLGWLYDTGRGVAENSGEALRWFSAAAAQGEAVGQANLGSLYDRGRGTPEDPKEAARWYLKAAEQGLAFAQWRLGSLYATGRGVARDEDQALRWLRAAAQAGNAEASSGIRIIEARNRARKTSPPAQ